MGKQSANLGKNNEPIQNRLSFLIDCKSVILHHFTILSFPMVRPAWDNWWIYQEKINGSQIQEVAGLYGTDYGCHFFFKHYHFPKRSKRDNETDEYTRSDSPWSTISGVMKYYRMSYEEVVNERSYSNIMLLNAAIPGTKPKEEGEKEKSKELHANEYFAQFM